ncbi:MAG: S1/P1 nuclease [Prevotellaceae bacterium]|jgi:hypothetical protein|nr:S1/P1 nuclease [Prevotellaceae bacterium]
MNNNMYLKAALILFLMSATLSLPAYNVVGHRIIAEIAYKNLNEKTCEQVDNILGKRGVIYTSSWADEIKSDKSYAYSYPWHYQNLKAGLSAKEIKTLLENPAAEGKHLFFAIDEMIARLKKDKNDAEALKFLVHFIGDLYQPLHLGRPEDKGGNKVQMRWFGKGTNIHAVWDGSLIDSRKMSSSEYAAFLEDKFEPRKEEIKRCSYLESILKIYETANEIYNYDLSDTNNYHYIYRFMDRQDEMLFMGGIRLANILNSIF